MLKWSKPCSPKSMSHDADSISNNSVLLFGYDSMYEADISKDITDEFISNERISHKNPLYDFLFNKKNCYEQKDLYLIEYEMIMDSLDELRKWIEIETANLSEKNSISQLLLTFTQTIMSAIWNSRCQHMFSNAKIDPMAVIKLVTQITLVENNIFNCLGNELILNKLLTKIFVFSKKKKFVRKIICIWNHRETIFKFFEGCKTLGVDENNLFTINDWNYVIKHQEYSFQDDQWIYSVKNYSEFSGTRQERFNFLTENQDEITAQPIEFRSYIKYKDKVKTRNILNKWKKKDRNKRSKLFHGLRRNSTPATKSVSESLSMTSDEGYFTSATCRSSFLRVVQKEQKHKFEKKSINSCNLNGKPFSKPYQNSNAQNQQISIVNSTCVATESEMNNLNIFLTEFFNNKNEDSSPKTKSKKDVNDRDEQRKCSFFNNEKMSPLQNQASHHYSDINRTQSSVNEIQSNEQLTTELKNVINDLLTIGNAYSGRDLDNLLTEKSLDFFFETITIPVVLSSESECSANEEYTSSDEYTLRSMPARLKDEKHKKEKDENKKKHKNTDKNVNKKKEKVNENAFENINHYETIDTPNFDRSLYSEPHRSRKSDRKPNQTNKKKTLKHEKSLHADETAKREIYETISDKNYSKMTAINNQNDNRLYLNPQDVSTTIQDDSGITNSNLVAAKSKLKPPKYLNPPKDASLKRNNSIHIKEPEYTWDTADGRHRVYLRSKESEASQSPDKNVFLNEHDTKFNGKLRNNRTQDDIQEILGVSPEIIELLKEEERFWQKQQELKKWVESRDKVNNVRKPPLQPTRTQTISINGKVNGFLMSESEREIEEERIEKEVDRLMFLRAQRKHILQAPIENISRNDEKRYDQLNHSSILSNNSINGRNTKGRSSVHFSTNNKPVYQRSTSIRQNRRVRSGNCFSDDDEVFNDYRRDNAVDNRGYFSDHDTVLKSPTFNAGPKKTGNNLRIKCTSCSRSILDERLINIDGYNYNWHVKCFFCVVCRAYLNDKHIVRVRVVDSRLHCRFCYSARNGELMSEV
ncbi:uncharacterized protein LOC100204021 isoform X2 [Hydra vulgaris]|uniref:uncharacterized protein LOC100204021 isoform X2 n=1 Tax=Hydra vulgaris TaxID=6087 RepID=UPI001F5EF2ED|nr:uncharacterized protein LOC100204021 isoform X2 [Hydra vulgaris]